jgi:hypothetical protein
MWLINREYTRRGVLPIFRQLPHPDDDTELMADLFWYDLEWLNARHQGHKPFLMRWKEIFRSKEFPHKTAKYIYESTGCQIWQTVKSLALENDWQTELNFIKTGVHRSAIARLDRLKPEVLNSLRVAHYERGRKLQSAEDKKTIERRIDIWFCGCIAKKSPQQTADLYEAMTGNKITRQLAAKLMEQVKKDVPGAFRKNWEPS